MRVPDAVLEQASEFVAARLGLNFPRERWPDLASALRAAAGEMGFAGVEPCVRWLLAAPLTLPQTELLASKLTVGETYFFREPQAFEALRQRVVPQLVASRREAQPQLRVWSAGCCTGEEAYSLAIFFDRECPELHGWGINILATDINPGFLRKAREGVYGDWSFRSAPPWLQPEYFTRLGHNRFELRANIRRRVMFEHLNLAQDVYPSLRNHTNGLDIIFCRNVLMYFTPEHVRRVVEGFHRSLVEDGHLVVSVCEASPTLAPQFEPRPVPGATLYQKKSRRPVSVETNASDSPVFAATHADSPLFKFPAPATAQPAPPAPATVMRSEIARAEELMRGGDYAGAAHRLESALASAPLDVDAATALARALANQGRLADARRWIERALSADKLRAPLHYLRAGVLQELGEISLAMQALENALYLEPDLVVAHVAIAELARSGGRPAKSALHLAQALRVLRRYKPHEVIPEADDLTAGRLIAIIEAMQPAEVTT